MLGPRASRGYSAIFLRKILKTRSQERIYACLPFRGDLRIT